MLSIISIFRYRTLHGCADFKPTVNPQLEVNQYPLPTPEDLFSKLADGVLFTVLDLSHAYQQTELTEDSRQYNPTRDCTDTLDCPMGLRQHRPFSRLSWKVC